MVVDNIFKKTEVGLIPVDWECRELKHYLSFISYGFTNPMPTVNDGIYMITANDINFGRIQFNSARRTSLEAYLKLLTEKSRPKHNDILLTKDGSLGRLALVGEENICINQSVAVIRPNKRVIPIFLKYLLESEYYQKTMLENAGGSTIKHIYITIVDKMKVCLPNLIKEQTAIANALSDMDALIAQAEKIIEKKKAIKQGVMQELLRPKEGWVTKKLGEICEIIGGGTPSTNIPVYWNGEINWFTPTEVGEEKYLHTSRRKITQLGLNSCSARILPAGTILLTTRAGIGDLGILSLEAATNQGFQSLLPRDGIDNEFVYYMMQTKKSELLQNASGSTFLEISPKKLKSIEISIPSKESQKEIASVLQEIDTIIYLTENKLQKLKLQKQGMMQALLTGKIRLA